jgi:hypothetical protein
MKMKAKAADRRASSIVIRSHWSRGVTSSGTPRVRSARFRGTSPIATFPMPPGRNRHRTSAGPPGERSSKARGAASSSWPTRNSLRMPAGARPGVTPEPCARFLPAGSFPLTHSYQTTQRTSSALTIASPALQAKVCANGSKFESGPSTLYFATGCGSPCTISFCVSSRVSSPRN